MLAAVRSATAGMPADETAAAPFQSGRWLLSHNGVVDRALLGPHPPAESVCDSAQLAAHLFDSAPSGPASSSPTWASVTPAARLNLLLTDGQRILATRWNDTLSVLRTDDGVVVASEPYDDDPRWADVPDHHLVDATDGAVTLTDLESMTDASGQSRPGSPGRLPRAAARRRARRPDRPTPKTLPPKYFYDARGSELFDEITRLPEYYPTRAETAILERHAAEIAALSRCESLVELGSGTSAKTRLLLRALLRRRHPARVRALRRRPGRADRGQRGADGRVPGPADRAVPG